MLSLERQNLQVHCVQPFEDWGKLVGDVPSATAILDRFLHHAEVIAITGRSYRLRNQAALASDTPATPKPANAPIAAAGSDTQPTVASEPNSSSPRRRKTAPQSV